MVEPIDSNDSATGVFFDSNIDNIEMEEPTKELSGTSEQRSPEAKQKQIEVALKEKNGIDHSSLAKTLPVAPTTVQDLENQLTKLATTAPDRNVKALAAVFLTEIETLVGKNLSLITIEAWEYAATIAKLTTNSEYWIGFSNLTASEKPLFTTATGITDFESKLSSHSFTTTETTEIAKAFSDGTLSLQNANDLKFMQTFYSNLQKGQQPKAAEENAYTTVPRSSVSQAMQTFITGIVNPNPLPFNPHTPTSIQDLESQITKLATTAPDRNVKALAAVFLTEIQTLAGKNLSLTTIEAWEYAATIAKLTTNSEYWIGFSNLTASEKPLFTTATGITDFESKLSSHSFTTTETTEIAKAFFDGSISLENVNDTKFMQAFYSELQKGQQPKAAEENAYTTVPRSSVSQAMQTFITGIANPSPTPPPFTPHVPTTIEDLKSELSQFANQGASCKTLADATLKEVTTLQGKSLSLTTVESWAYAAIIGKMTSDSQYSTGFASLNPSEQQQFKTLTGIDDFNGKLSSHSFSTAETTEIAKTFSDGSISLENENDTKFMQAFYSNLHSGQDPKTAAQNAYKTVPSSSVSQTMQSFIQGLSNYAPTPPTPSPFPSPFKEDTVVDSVTVYQLTIPGYGPCTFPIGGNQAGQCTSEAMGMMLRYAVNSKNKDLFQSLMNGYEYISSKGIGDALMPWSYKVDNGTVTILDKGSALDADIMSIGEMIKGSQLFGSLTLGNGQSVDTVIKQSISGLAKDDIVNDNTFAPGNHWGGTHTVWGDPKFYDYVDFINIQRILDFCKSNNMTTEMNKITAATNQYINYEFAHVTDVATTGGGDNNASLVRVLIYLGLFISDPANKTSPFYKNLATLLDQVVTQAMQAKTLSVTYDPHSGWFGNNGVQILGDKNQYATIGAYLLALNALSKSGYTELQGQSIDSLTQTGVAILNSYLKNEDDGNSIISQLKKDIQDKTQWNNGVYFNYMMFTECWPVLSTIDGVKPQ